MDLAALWTLDPDVVFLNHGSFGACPREVLEVQRAWRDRMEAEPVTFLGRELEGHLDRARAEVASFIGADPEDLAFVANATAGVNTVLRSLRFAPGDELLALDHEYNAALNALRFAAERDGARVVVAPVPFPIDDPEAVVAAVLAAVTPRTRLALISHVTSPTALVLPIERLVAELAARGVDALVDGAHAPGMVPLRVGELGAAYYTGNGHKWLCGPKGTAFLHVRRDRQAAIRPLAISHGANDPRTTRSRFRLEADWTGTADPTAHLSLPAAIGFIGRLRPGGWAEQMAANRALALAGRELLCAALGIGPPSPDTMVGSMASFPLPGRRSPDGEEPLGERLLTRHRIEVPVMDFPVPAAREPGREPSARLLRISAQAYNRIGQYEVLAGALLEELAAEGERGDR
jgi:isopenicillin-N epimerase